MKTKRMRELKLFASALLPLFVLAGCGAQQTAQQPTGTNTQTNQNQNQPPISSTTQPAEASVDVMAVDNPAMGRIFTDGKGMTLYTYTKDAKGTSTCYGTCAVNWPPLTVTGSPKVAANLIADKFSTITRTDGTKQVTYEGMPLYYWFKDKNPGDVIGQGVGGVWFVYKVATDDLSSPSATSTATQ